MNTRRRYRPARYSRPQPNARVCQAPVSQAVLTFKSPVDNSQALCPHFSQAQLKPVPDTNPHTLMDTLVPICHSVVSNL